MVAGPRYQMKIKKARYLRVSGFFISFDPSFIALLWPNFGPSVAHDIVVSSQKVKDLIFGLN